MSALAVYSQSMIIYSKIMSSNVVDNYFEYFSSDLTAGQNVKVKTWKRICLPRCEDRKENWDTEEKSIHVREVSGLQLEIWIFT